MTYHSDPNSQSLWEAIQHNLPYSTIQDGCELLLVYLKTTEK